MRIEVWGRRSGCVCIFNICCSLLELNFLVSFLVDCNCGEYEPRTIVKTWYVGEPDFEENEVVPYQIQVRTGATFLKRFSCPQSYQNYHQLDTGSKTFAPDDCDKMVRKSYTPSPPCWICYDNNSEEGNPIVHECACRGEGNGFVHIKCLIQLAKSKIDSLEDAMDDSNPFVHCITCKQPFTGSASM